MLGVPEGGLDSLDPFHLVWAHSEVISYPDEEQAGTIGETVPLQDKVVPTMWEQFLALS
jgi:hypothetical protein